VSTETPRPSATVVLLRDTADGFEVYLVRRNRQTAFGDVWAFPGGVVEAWDARAVSRTTGLGADDANRLLDAPNALNYYSAAIRELFEETGVLLSPGGSVPPDARTARDELLSGSRDWPRFLEGAGFYADAGALHYLSYWVTPEGRSRRFATRFFVARLPTGQAAVHCGGELVDGAWQTPRDALDLHRAGQLPMIFPTIRTLEHLARHSGIEAVIADADRRASAGITELLPRLVTVDGEERIVVNGDPDYAESPAL
jgi:8-oxo-dGTP pyrophosphatase MutT (NUDIX family)